MNRAKELIKKINKKLTPEEAQKLEKEVYKFLTDKNISDEEKNFLINNAYLEMMSMMANCDSTQK